MLSYCNVSLSLTPKTHAGRTQPLSLATLFVNLSILVKHIHGFLVTFRNTSSVTSLETPRRSTTIKLTIIESLEFQNFVLRIFHTNSVSKQSIRAIAKCIYTARTRFQAFQDHQPEKAISWLRQEANRSR